MECRLYDETDELLNPLEQILSNRGVGLDEQEHWLNANMKDINDWRLLDNMELAVRKVHDAVESSLNTVIIQDCDLDGVCSTSIFLNYIDCVTKPRVIDKMEGRKHFVDDCVTILLHEGKQHGLADLMDKIPKETKLLVVPDAGRITA